MNIWVLNENDNLAIDNTIAIVCISLTVFTICARKSYVTSTCVVVDTVCTISGILTWIWVTVIDIWKCYLIWHKFVKLTGWDPMCCENISLFCQIVLTLAGSLGKQIVCFYHTHWTLTFRSMLHKQANIHQ